jgi:hypothetical protein
MNDEKSKFEGFPWGGIIFLVVVVAFAGILIIPKYLNRGIRGGVSMVEAQQRSIAIALESFRNANGRLPTMREYYDATMLNYGIPESDPPIEFTLTSPISHIAALPGDPFHPQPHSHHYMYYTDVHNCWILGSCGPDRKPSFFDGKAGAFRKEHAFVYGASDANPDDPSAIFGCMPRFWSTPYEGGHPQGWGHYNLYSPTNGSRSKGDIIKTGP